MYFNEKLFFCAFKIFFLIFYGFSLEIYTTFYPKAYGIFISKQKTLHKKIIKK